MDKEFIAELTENYVLNRLTEAEISTLELLDREPQYLSTFGKLPELFIPRYFWPEKGNFLPGVYYNSLLNGKEETIFSKNLELGFIGIWWHNFGYYSFIYVCLILLLTLLVRNFNTVFLLLFELHKYIYIYICMVWLDPPLPLFNKNADELMM